MTDTVFETVKTATVNLGGGPLTLPVLSGRFELDSGWSPYGRAYIVVPAIDPTLLDALDPRETVRVSLDLQRRDAFGVVLSSRTANLQLRKRTIDHNGGTMRLELYTDELLLQRKINKTANVITAATAYQSSVRNLVNWALGQIGASLQAGTVNSTFWLLENATNLLVNPSFQTNTTGWTIWAGTGGAATLSRPTSGGKEGAAYGRATWTTAASVPSAGLYFADVPMTAGKTYTFAGWLRSSLAQKVNVGVEWKTAANAANGANSGTVVTLAANTWTRVSLTATAPANTTKGTATFYGATTGSNWTVNSTLDVDGASVVENKGTAGIDYTAYFDGSTTATADYGYAWTGTAHASTSTRTALVNRSPDALRWEPGQDLWSMLRPILDMLGFRLFCDEQRKWRLVDSSYALPDRVTLSEGFNVTEGTDEVDLDARSDNGTPIFYDCVVLEYRWKDATGAEQIAYDVAGTGDNGLSQRIDLPYPGPGAANYILQRAVGKGRVQDVTGLVDYSVTPGQAIAIALPMTNPQTGTVTGVGFDFETDLMNVKSRGLTDTPADSWYFVPDALKWADVPDTTTWENYTP